MLLAALSLSATSLDSVLGDEALQSVRIILYVYLVYAALLTLAAPRLGTEMRARYWIHATDVLVSSALMYVTDGSGSPFYVFFVYIMVAGTLRWNWKGAIITAAVLSCILLLLVVIGLRSELPGTTSEEDDLGRALIRGGFLLVCGGLLAYMGAFQERSRRRFARLAAWPSTVTGAALEDRLARTLAHAASVMRAPRALLIWEQPDEPFRHLLLWAQGEISQSRERAELFGSLVAPTHADRAFIAGAEIARAAANSRAAPPIEPDLRRMFNITTAVTAPFHLEKCSGRIFMLDRETWTEDDIPLATIIASRLGIELEDGILREQVGAAMAMRERVRVARDLHDGVLQGLAAASIQLKIASDQLPPPIQEELKSVRGLLSAETKRIRAFVDETRSLPSAAPGVVELTPELQNRIESLREQWGRDIELTIDPGDITASVSVAHEVRHLVTEAVSNAIRHGNASRIAVSVEKRAGGLSLRILDDGRGFQNLTGSFHQQDLEERKAGPVSLRSRVDDMGGKLFLTSSPEGTDIRIELAA